MRYGMLSSRLPHGYKCLLRVLHVPKKPAFFPFFYSFTKPWVVAACTSHTLLSLPSFPSSPRPTHWPILLRPVVTVASRFPSPSVPSTPQNITAWFRNPSRMFLPYLPTCSADKPTISLTGRSQWAWLRSRRILATRTPLQMVSRLRGSGTLVTSR